MCWRSGKATLSIHRHRPEQGAVLEQHADLAPQGQQLGQRLARDRLAFDDDVARVREHQADDVLDQHALAGARGAEHDRDRLVRDADVQPVQHRHSAQALVHVQAADRPARVVRVAEQVELAGVVLELVVSEPSPPCDSSRARSASAATRRTCPEHRVGTSSEPSRRAVGHLHIADTRRPLGNAVTAPSRPRPDRPGAGSDRRQQRFDGSHCERDRLMRSWLDNLPSLRLSMLAQRRFIAARGRLRSGVTRRCRIAGTSRCTRARTTGARRRSAPAHPSTRSCRRSLAESYERHHNRPGTRGVADVPARPVRGALRRQAGLPARRARRADRADRAQRHRADRRPARWSEQVRVGLQTLLAALACHPDGARVACVEYLSAGEPAIARMRAAIAGGPTSCGRLAGGARAEAPNTDHLPPQTSEAVIGGIAAIVQRRVLNGRTASSRVCRPACHPSYSGHEPALRACAASDRAASQRL